MQKLLFERCKGIPECESSIKQENTNSVSEMLENPIAEYMEKASLKDLEVMTIDNTILAKTIISISP